MKVVLFCEILKSGDGRTTCVKIVITTGRDCASAEWIKNSLTLIVLSVEPDINTWSSSQNRHRTLSSCPRSVRRQSPVLRHHTFNVESYEPEITRFLLCFMCMQRTVSWWPTMVTLQPIEDHSGWISKSQTLIVRSVLPLT